MGKQLIHVRNSVILLKPGLSGQDFQPDKAVTEFLNEFVTLCTHKYKSNSDPQKNYFFLKII